MEWVISKIKSVYTIYVNDNDKSLEKIVYDNGGVFYYKDYGKKHRLDGPAVEVDSYKEWWVEGENISCTTQEEFERLMKLKAFW